MQLSTLSTQQLSKQEENATARLDIVHNTSGITMEHLLLIHSGTTSRSCACPLHGRNYGGGGVGFRVGRG